MATLVTTVTETLRYRGKIGQWSWVFHRTAGIGTLLFLVIHVIDTSWVTFAPELYEEAISIYQTPLFTLGEFFLVACVVYHAFNGVRIALFDYRPAWWRYQARAATVVYLATLVVLVPVFVLMGQHVVEFYSGRPIDLALPLIISKLAVPFGGGMIAALLAGIVLSFVFSLTGNKGIEGPRLTKRSRFDSFMWSFMRISGVLLLPLALGHLAIMHVIEGVFAINQGGTDLAANFVAARWAFLGWRIYDALLLALALIHGFNGFRYVINDYAHNPVVRRGLNWAAFVACIAIIVVGGLALIMGIPGM